MESLHGQPALITTPARRRRSQVRFMEISIRFFACIGTMNPSESCHRYGVPPSLGPDRL